MADGTDKVGERFDGPAPPVTAHRLPLFHKPG